MFCAFAACVPQFSSEIGDLRSVIVEKITVWWFSLVEIPQFHWLGTGIILGSNKWINHCRAYRMCSLFFSCGNPLQSCWCKKENIRPPYSHQKTLRKRYDFNLVDVWWLIMSFHLFCVPKTPQAPRSLGSHHWARAADGRRQVLCKSLGYAGRPGRRWNQPKSW